MLGKWPKLVATSAQSNESYRVSIGRQCINFEIFVAVLGDTAKRYTYPGNDYLLAVS